MQRFFSGLFITLIAAAMAAGCTPSRTTKSAGEQVDDSVVTARVKTALVRELGTGNAIRTDVETFRGRVQLNGYVDSAEKKSEATRIARAVQGVTDVENNLRVSTTARTTGEVLDDRVLATRIKTALARDPVVSAREVNVDVRQGVVQLGGFVDTAEEKSRAAELARDVEGVDRVDNNLEVKRR